MPLGPWRAVIADDHAVLAEGARAMLEGSGRIEVVATAAEGLGAIVAIKREKPDIALLDLAMPNANGIEVFIEAKRWSPETRYVVFTGQVTGGAVAALVEAGVHGVFLKTGDPGELVAALPRIMAGQQVVSDGAKALMQKENAFEQPTARELQVLQAIARGGTNAAVAGALGISAKTVDNHRTNLMRKFGAHSTAELVMAGVRLGLLDPSAAPEAGEAEK